MSDPLWILGAGMLVVVGGILGLRLHAFLALLLGALVVGFLTPASSVESHELSQGATAEEARSAAKAPVAIRVANGLGGTVSKIGILIALAAIIGKCLLDTGAADRIVRSSLKLLGERGAPAGFLGSGFMLGIPVFADTVFYLLIPLAKAMVVRTGRNYTLLVLAIVAGTTMAHSLVPPTPGPLLVASRLGVDIGQMIVVGLVVGLSASAAGFAYALWANRRWPIPLRESTEVSLAKLRELTARRDRELPPLWLSWLPIVLPILLIGGRAIAQANVTDGAGSMDSPVVMILDTLGEPNLALMLSAAIALGMLAWRFRRERDQLSAAVQSALASGGTIILITAAGGAFGGMLQQTGIGGRIEELSAAFSIGVLPLAFAVTALIRIAQGSATVAMITAVGVLEGFGDPAQLGFHPVYLAAAIGCGSKPIPWMNDSGFWIICKLSNFTEAETFKTFSLTLAIMGCVGLVVTMLLARLLPMI